MKNPPKLDESLASARVGMEALRETLEKLRAESTELKKGRAALLPDKARFDHRLAELEVSMAEARAALTGDFRSMLDVLEADAEILRQEWEAMRRSFQSGSTMHDVVEAMRRSAPPMLAAQAAKQLLRRMESGPAGGRLQFDQHG